MDFVEFDELEKEYTALKSKENEEQIELRRLRTENRLLRQRIDNLEKESASLADRLIQDQVIRAQEAEQMYALKNDLSVLKQSHLETHKKLEDADVLIAEVKRRTKCIEDSDVLTDDDAKGVIKQLQEELIGVRLKEAETSMLIKELKTKIKELEDTNLKMQRAPSNDIQHLQEELIAVKLREAEANLSLKELRQKVNEIESYWESYMERQNSVSTPKEKNSKQEIKHLQEELMTFKVKEAQAVAETKETKQKVMELETQNHICSNQIRRMDEDSKSLKLRIQESAEHEREMKTTIKEFMRKIDDMETRKKEECMMARIKEAENTSMMAELKQKIASIEIQKEEIVAAGRLHGEVGTQELENQIYDLQDEVMQLKLTVLPPTDDNTTMGSSFYNDDCDEVSEALEDSESLNRTLSEIVDGKGSSAVLENGDNNHDGEARVVPNGDSVIHNVEDGKVALDNFHDAKVNDGGDVIMRKTLKDVDNVKQPFPTGDCDGAVSTDG